MRFSEAHGCLAAIASAPTTIMPSVWQPVLLGEGAFSSMVTPVASRPPEIGRNEPCPCGSVRKDEKCCALKEQ